MIDPSSENSYGIAGNLNLHGTLIPVYSMRKIFGFSDRAPRLTDNLIITKISQSDIALWVDETYVIRDYGISPAQKKQDSDVPIIPGVTVLPDGLVIIHDVALFLENQTKKGPILISDIGKERRNTMMTDLNPDEGITDINDTKRTSILKERAEELAKPVGISHEVLSIEVLKFKLVYSEYAIDMQYVRESILSREITPVPGAPDHILGVLSVRGEIIPLIDLRVLLSIPEKGLTDFNQVIVVTDGIITFGILVDQITEITSIPKDQICPPGSLISPEKPDYILGIAPESLIVINAGKILSDPDIIVDQSRE